MTTLIEDDDDSEMLPGDFEWLFWLLFHFLP